MKIAVLNHKGEKVRDIELSKSFEVKVSPSALALYVNYINAALREPIANTKNRGEVSGGGKKPWKQKGTGRARHGSSRSPLWVGGGVTFGPTSDQNFKLRINKTLKRKVILWSIGQALIENRGLILENLAFDAPKTKDAIEVLNNVKAEGKIAMILSESDKNAEISFRNIQGVNLMEPGKLNVKNILSSSKVIISEDSIKKIEELLVK